MCSRGGVLGKLTPRYCPAPAPASESHSEWGLQGGVSGRCRLTFRGRMGTLSLSEFMPGMMTVMRRGPRKPSTLVSWEGGAP